MTRIRFTDFRKAQVCVNDSRPWLIARGVNWRNFLRNGIEADELRRVAAGDQAERIDRLELAAREREAASWAV